VLFINASNEAEQHPEVRKLNRLSDGNIQKIADAYKKFTEEKGFSRIVTLQEILQNDNNLNVTLYVMHDEENEGINIAQEYAELKELEKQKHEAASKLEQIIVQLTQGAGE